MATGTARRVSKRSASMGPSATHEAKRVAEERHGRGEPVYDMGIGEAQATPPQAALQGGREAFEYDRTGYAPPEGVPELRDRILHWLGVSEHYDRQNVIVSGGAKSVFDIVFTAICDPGDTLLVDAAPWVSYCPIAALRGIKSERVIPNSDQHLKITPDDLEQAFKKAGKGVRALLVNSPCNPTAQVYWRDELEALMTKCNELGIYLILDRLYWRIMFDGHDFPAPAINDESRPNLIQVDGLSKNLGKLGGLRVGWSVLPDDVAAAVKHSQAHVSAGAAVPSQFAALHALSSYDGQHVTWLSEKRTVMTTAATRVEGIQAFPIPGSFYAFWDLLLPGEDFAQPGYVRLSFDRPSDLLTAGTEVLTDELNRLLAA